MGLCEGAAAATTNWWLSVRVCCCFWLCPAVDTTGRSSLQELLHAVNVAERTSSSEASELPLGQWEVEALRGRADILPPQLLMASPAQSARKLSVEALAGMADVLVMSGRCMCACVHVMLLVAVFPDGKQWSFRQAICGQHADGAKQA